MATTNSARPYTIDAEKPKIFLRPVRSESRPPMRAAAMRTADWASVPRNICCGTSATVLPIFLQQVVGLVGDQEGIGQDEHQTARESPREVGALSRIDI